MRARRLLPEALSSDNGLTITLTVTDEEDTMATSATIPGPTPHRIVDLDAGTTLPRAVSVVATVLAAAALVATLIAGQPADPPSHRTSLAPVAPQAITIPAWRAGWGDLPRGAGPAWPVGPSALIDASATAASAVIGR
jgi:hypothetical protein